MAGRRGGPPDEGQRPARADVAEHTTGGRRPVAGSRPCGAAPVPVGGGGGPRGPEARLAGHGGYGCRAHDVRGPAGRSPRRAPAPQDGRAARSRAGRGALPMGGRRPSGRRVDGSDRRHAVAGRPRVAAPRGSRHARTEAVCGGPPPPHAGPGGAARAPGRAGEHAAPGGGAHRGGRSPSGSRAHAPAPLGRAPGAALGRGARRRSRPTRAGAGPRCRPPRGGRASPEADAEARAWLCVAPDAALGAHQPQP